jgi:hypothetical protein
LRPPACRIGLPWPHGPAFSVLKISVFVRS